ncbi:MAG: DNA polymerase III subunit epsilon [Acidobacteria bacterium]|nr:DNA polymerase III subunit epsilon [Acidobacteriota bacterium]
MRLKASILDVETTGFSHAADEVIELGIVLFDFDPLTGVAGSVVEEYGGLRDPGRPIPEDATKAHGLTWDDVRGHALDDAAVRRILARSAFLIAHNARFDRGFIERLYPETALMQWRCSMDDIPWRGRLGFRSKGLQQLLGDHGIGVDTAHRALDDARNTLRLLSRTQPDGRTYLAELLGLGKR